MVAMQLRIDFFFFLHFTILKYIIYKIISLRFCYGLKKIKTHIAWSHSPKSAYMTSFYQWLFGHFMLILHWAWSRLEFVKSRFLSNANISQCCIISMNIIQVCCILRSWVIFKLCFTPIGQYKLRNTRKILFIQQRLKLGEGRTFRPWITTMNKTWLLNFIRRFRSRYPYLMVYS